jgi:hypothetical protein
MPSARPEQVGAKQPFNTMAFTKDGRRGVYDLSRDATEQHDLAAAQPARCARLCQWLAAWTGAKRRHCDRLAR